MGLHISATDATRSSCVTASMTWGFRETATTNQDNGPPPILPTSADVELCVASGRRLDLHRASDRAELSDLLTAQGIHLETEAIDFALAKLNCDRLTAWASPVFNCKRTASKHAPLSARGVEAPAEP